MALALRNLMRPMLAEFSDPFFTRGSIWGPSFGSLLRETGQFSTPTFDIKETENEVIVEAMTPGYKKENLSVSLDRDRLVISGQEQSGREPSGQEQSGREPSSDGGVNNDQFFERRSFTQAFALPIELKDAHIKASYQDGVLCIRLPKPQVVPPKRIAIEEHPKADSTVEVEDVKH